MRDEMRSSQFEFPEVETPVGYESGEEKLAGTYDYETSEGMKELYSKDEELRNAVTDDGNNLIAGETTGEWIIYDEEDVMEGGR